MLYIETEAPKKQMPDLTNYVTTQEAAALLGYHVNYIRRMVRLGTLESMRVGNMLFISKESIEKYRINRLPPGRPTTKVSE